MNACIVKYFKILVPTAALFITWTGSAQVDSLKQGFQKEFDAFSNQIQQDFQSFQRANDSIFLEFLGQSWKSFEAFKSESVMKPKPKEQPVREKSELHLQPIRPGNIDLPGERSIMEPQDEKVDDPEPGMNTPGKPSILIDFYGSEICVRPPETDLPGLRQVSPLYFVEFFEKVADSPILTENIQLLRKQAKDLRLNDWGLICLLKAAASEFFRDPNEQTLYVWYGLIRCGYNIKTGYDQDKVFILAPSAEDLYNTVYFKIKGKTYFLLKLDGKEADIDQLKAYEADYPGNESAISLMIKDLPLIHSGKASRSINYQQELTFQVDRTLVGFFEGYPECELSVSLSAPLSDVALSSMDAILAPKFKAMNEMQIVEYLLKFIQYGFPYQIDEEQFGRENYLFPEEALFYPYSDCEDRSALFARLVQHFTNREVVALCYPDHVTTAVSMTENITGAFIDVGGKRFFVCDPTFIGAGIGMAMPGYEDIEPDIIVFK